MLVVQQTPTALLVFIVCALGALQDWCGGIGLVESFLREQKKISLRARHLCDVFVYDVK